MAWRGLLRRKGRSALTVLTVTIGVANVFGVFVINASIDRGIENRARFFAGGADATARTGPGSATGFSRPEIERFRDLDGVDDASAVTPVWDSDSPPGREGEDYFVSSIDSVGREVVLADRLIRGRLFEPGRPEVVLSQTFSRAFGLQIGDEWRTDLGRFREDVRASRFSSVSQTLEPGAPTLVRLEVTGILEDPPGSGNDPRFGSFMSLEYAWSVLRGDFAYEVRFFLEDGVDPAAWVVEHETGFQEGVFESSAITPELRRFVRTMQGMLAATSALALFIGAFLIYVTFSIAVVERTRLYGSLHAIGARGGQVAGAVFIEALTIGVVSSALGVVLGFVLSRGLTRLVQPVIPIFVESTAVTPVALAAALAVGVGATAVGAAVPALRAARTSPVEAMRDVPAATQRQSRSWVAGVVMLGGGLTFAFVSGLGRNLTISGAATLLVLLGAVLMTPLALALSAGAVRWIVRRIGGGLGEVAVMHVQRERSRSAYTMALVMLVLAAMLALGTANRSLVNILDEWMDKRFGADLLVYGPDITETLRRKLTEVRESAARPPSTSGRVLGSAPRQPNRTP